MRGCIQDASKITGVPSGTIRRWLSEGRLVRHRERKPYWVDYDEVIALRQLLLEARPSRSPKPPVAREPKPRRTDIGYEAAHRRVYRIHGRAIEHPCFYCGLPALQWAYDHDDPDEMVNKRGNRYSANPEHYKPLCFNCHSYLDRRYASIRRGELVTAPVAV